MKIKVEDVWGSPSERKVEVQVTSNGKWIDFGYMKYEERKELADQLRNMANELMKLVGSR